MFVCSLFFSCGSVCVKPLNQLRRERLSRKHVAGRILGRPHLARTCCLTSVLFATAAGPHLAPRAVRLTVTLIATAAGPHLAPRAVRLTVTLIATAAGPHLAPKAVRITRALIAMTTGPHLALLAVRKIVSRSDFRANTYSLCISMGRTCVYWTFLFATTVVYFVFEPLWGAVSSLCRVFLNRILECMGVEPSAKLA